MSFKMDKKQIKALGKWFFKYRDYTPIPLVLLLLSYSAPTAFSATLGLLTILLGEFVRIYSVCFIGSISRTRKDRVGGKLVTEGLFGVVRNPLYVGNFFIVMGFAIYSAQLWLVMLTAGLFALQYHFIVQYEEDLLKTQFGAEYTAYQEEVPAWIPKKLPGRQNLPAPTGLDKALLSEKRTLTSIGVLIFLLSFFS